MVFGMRWAIRAASLGAGIAAVAVLAAQGDREWTGDVLVRVRDGRSVGLWPALAPEVRVAESPAGSDVRRLRFPSLSRDEAVRRARSLPGVVYAEPNWRTRIAQSNDPRLGEQWAWPRVDLFRAWNLTRGQGIRVAVLDTGVDASHPDLAGRLTGGANFTSQNFGDFADRNGHGTMCAGLVAANRNNGIGIAGVAPEALVMPIKVLGDNGSGNIEQLVAGIRYAVQNGAQILSISIAASGPSDLLRQAIDEATNRGLLVIAAAGNGGTMTQVFPGAYPNVLTVAATTRNDQRASFSSYGTWVDVAAPGVDILSTAVGGGYTTLSGTSMSAPIVAGQAALVFQNLGARATAIQVRRRIESTCDRVGDFVVHGRINVARSVGADQPPPPTLGTQHFADRFSVAGATVAGGGLGDLSGADGRHLSLRASGAVRGPALALLRLRVPVRTPERGGGLSLTVQGASSSSLQCTAYLQDARTRAWRRLGTLALGPSPTTLTLPPPDRSISGGTVTIVLVAKHAGGAGFEVAWDLVRITSSDGGGG